MRRLEHCSILRIPEVHHRKYSKLEALCLMEHPQRIRKYRLMEEFRIHYHYQLLSQKLFRMHYRRL